MATVLEIATYRKPQGITHYAYLGEVYGTAELVNGSGYLFRAEGERKATLVSYRDVNLMLLGLVDVADAQHDIDMIVGGYAAVACGRAEGVA
jgi:hypothetical protein